MAGDRLELVLVQPVTDADCEHVHSLGLQSQPLRHGRLAVVGTSVGEDDNEVGDVTAVAVSGRVHRVGDVAKGGGGVGCAVSVSCVHDGLLHVGAAIG